MREQSGSKYDLTFREKGKDPVKTETIINQGNRAGQAKITLEETCVALLGQNNGTRGWLKYGYSRGKLAMTPKELVEDSWLPVLVHASRAPSSVTGGSSAQNRDRRAREGWGSDKGKVPVQGNPVFQQIHIVVQDPHCVFESLRDC